MKKIHCCFDTWLRTFRLLRNNYGTGEGTVETTGGQHSRYTDFLRVTCSIWVSAKPSALPNTLLVGSCPP